MKKIQVSYLFENAGLCTDVFKSVDSPRRFYDRNTESGIWYTATPTAYENDSRIRHDVIVEVIADGQVIALDGNSDFAGKKPFIPFCVFEKELTKSFSEQHPDLHGYEEMKRKLLSLPGGAWYAEPQQCWENWVFNLDFGNETEQIVGTASWLGREYQILAVRYTHSPTGFVFTNYRFRAASRPEKSSSHDLLLYAWQEDSLCATVCDHDKRSGG